MRAVVLALVVAMVIGASGTAAADPQPASPKSRPATQQPPAESFDWWLLKRLIARPLRLGETFELVREFEEQVRSGLPLGSARTEVSTYDQLIDELAADFVKLRVVAD